MLSRSSISPRVALWSLFAVALAVACLWKLASNSQFYREQAARERKTIELRAKEQAARVEVTSILSPRHDWSRQSLDETLPGKQPLDIAVVSSSSAPPQNVAIWHHPSAALAVEFRFDQQENVIGWQTHATWAGQLPTVSRAAFSNAGEYVRWGASIGLKIVWLVLFAGYLLDRSQRLQYAEWMLACSLATAAADAVDPSYTASFAGIFANDTLMFSAGQVVISIAALVALSNRARFTGQFSLRTLLVATTIAAVLTALATPAYVALVVIGCGAWIIFSQLRRLPQP